MKSKKQKIKGQGMVEYVLVVSLLALVAVGVNKMFAKSLKSYFGTVSYYRAGSVGQLP